MRKQDSYAHTSGYESCKKMMISLSILLIFWAVLYYILIARSPRYDVSTLRPHLLDLRSDESNWMFIGPGLTSCSTSERRCLESPSTLAIFPQIPGTGAASPIATRKKKVILFNLKTKQNETTIKKQLIISWVVCILIVSVYFSPYPTYLLMSF